MSDQESETSLVTGNVSDSEDIENVQSSDDSGDYSSKTPSPLENLVLDPNFVCATQNSEKSSRLTRSSKCKSVGDLYEQAIAAQFARKSVAVKATSTADATGSATQPRTHKSSSKPLKMDPQIKQAFKEMSDSFKAVGLSAKHNSTSFLNDIPYFGVSPSSEKSKNIIPLNEATRFLDIIDLVTGKCAFDDAGKIHVLKSKLLGKALEHWNLFDGGDDWVKAREHLLRLFPEVQSYTSVMAKIPLMKREKQEQISEYASRIVQTYNTLQRLHPSKNYPDVVKQSDGIRKLLEVLPSSERKWIKISDPGVNNFWEVLNQILKYVESEPSLKLTVEDIDKEQKPKSGTVEVNVVSQNVPSQTQASQSQQIAGKNQTSGSGGNPVNKKNNPDANKTCNYCHNKGHTSAICRKKAWAESIGRNPKSNYQNNKNSANGNNFKYNPQQNKGSGGNKDNIRCNFCNIKGHMIANCRFRQKEAYQNSGNVERYNYCKCVGHHISVCKKRLYKESQSGNNSNVNSNSAGNSNFGNNNPRRCFRCGDTTHIAKFCNNNYANQNF